jgi:hypothetical protein
MAYIIGSLPAVEQGDDEDENNNEELNNKGAVSAQRV